MVFAAPVAAAAQSHNTLLRRAPIEVEITLSDPDTDSAYFSLSGINDMNNMILLPPQVRIAAGATNRRDSWHCRLEVDMAGKQVRARRGAGSLGADITIRTLAVEFMPWVLEYNAFSVTGFSSPGSTELSIPALTKDLQARTAIIYNGDSTNQNTQSLINTAVGVRRNASHEDGQLALIYRRSGSSGQTNMTFSITAFSKGVLQNDKALQGLVTIDGTDTSDTGPIFDLVGSAPDAYDEDMALMLYNGFAADGGFQANQPALEFVSDSFMRGNRGTGFVNDDVDAHMTVLPFREKWCTGGENGMDRIAASSTTEDVSLTELSDTDKALYAFLGLATDNAAANIDRFPATLDLTAADNLRLQRGLAASNYVDVGWSVVQFR